MLNKTTGLLLLATSFFISASGQQAGIVKPEILKHETTPVAATDLYNQIYQADSLLFSAFNACDSISYKKYFTNDLEFYHDIGGLSVGIQIELQEFKEMCARGSHIRRELVKSSLEVHPIGDYGAVEIGVHRFFHTNKGEQEKPSGTYKFVEVWQKKNDQWKLSRVISYGHDNMKNN